MNEKTNSDRTKDWKSTQSDLNEIAYNNLTQLTTTTLYVLGMLSAKQDWVPAKFLATTLLKQGVQCDYLQMAIDKANELERSL